MKFVSRLLGGVIAATITVALAACGLQIPQDPRGTFDRVESGILRVGVSEPNTTALEELMLAFAEANGATIVWSWGSEETLVRDLEAQRLDVAIGGFTSDSPWSDRAAVSRGYPQLSSDPELESAVLVPLGENRMLTQLELFFDEELKQ